MVTLIAAGLLGFLLFFLGAYVVAGRVKFKIDNGDGGSAAMRQRIRAQANFVEYVPLALILLLLADSRPSEGGPMLLPMRLLLAAVVTFAAPPPD